VNKASAVTLTIAVLTVLSACKKEAAPYLPGRSGRRRESWCPPGIRRSPARHHRRSEIQGVRRDSPAQCGNRSDREAGCAAVRIDPEMPATRCSGPGQLDVAKAKLANSTGQKRRADELYQSRSITEQSTTAPARYADCTLWLTTRGASHNRAGRCRAPVRDGSGLVELVGPALLTVELASLACDIEVGLA